MQAYHTNTPKCMQDLGKGERIIPQIEKLVKSIFADGHGCQAGEADVQDFAL